MTFKVIDREIEKMLLPYKDSIDKGTNWVINQKKKSINIKSYDGLKLHSELISHKNEKGIIILAHGYRSTKERDLYASLYNYYNMGYSLLLIDQRGCGLSEGKYITFGYYESKDIDKWVDYIYKHHKTKIILAGISLGASSVLMVNNRHVSCIISDSAYSNAYNEVKYCINHYFHLPGFIFMPMLCFYTRIFAKFSLKKCDTIKNIKNLNIPILFIHGLDDDFVPYKSSIDNYNHYNGKKDILLIKGATHGMGYLVDSKSYLNKIKHFI
jgi:pimeloyl-ACP methyl ester carboxylesterase